MMYGEKQKKTLLLTGDSINNSMEKTHTDDLYSRINLEKTSIENPKTIVIDVLSIATPTVE